MKKIFNLLFLFLISGCSMLRYNYEYALTQLPTDSKVVKITNDYILYSTNEPPQFFKAFYSSNGTIYKTDSIANQIP